MKPKALSRFFREADISELNRRRWVIGLSLLGAAMGQIVSLYQTGIVRHLPDPPAGPFDSDRVDASDYAYSRMETPDGLMMVASYAVTALLAGAGGPDRTERHPALPIAMAAKVLYDTGLAAELAREEWRENRALCAYCQVATLCSAASLAFALPEATRAARRLLGTG